MDIKYTLKEKLINRKASDSNHQPHNGVDDSENVNVHKILHDLKHYLPTQTPLKDFIHHNTLHAFQKNKFYDAIFRASKIFGYQATLQLTEYRQLFKIGRIKNEVLENAIAKRKGAENIATWKEFLLNKDYEASTSPRIGLLRANWKHHYEIDLDLFVQPLLFRILSSYLDQGISIWNFPVKSEGFIFSLKELERNSLVSLFKTSRARQLLLSGKVDIKSLLAIVVGDTRYAEQYLFDQQFTHQGWSGMVATLESQPHAILDPKPISLEDLIKFELLLEIDTLDFHFGEQWQPLSKKVETGPQNLFDDIQESELNDVFILWQDAFEWSYYDEVLSGILHGKTIPAKANPEKNFQAFFCIDERECSIRRHIESIDEHCETFGTPGFFSVEFYFQPENGNFYDKLCPAPVTPKYLIKETVVKNKHEHDLFYTKRSHTFLAGSAITLSFGFWSLFRLVANLFRPKMNPAISNAFGHIDKETKLKIENTSIDDRENDLQVGFTVPEMATRVESLLRSIGHTSNFAPIIYSIGHGSSSANNPHHGAHDCGACSGRPGSVNARVFSFMANHAGVRNILKAKGIEIPPSTQFVGALHDTAGDEIEFYDEDVLTSSNLELHKRNVAAFEKALDLNAKERSRRFASINTRKPLTKVREAIKQRSVSLFEPRPELGHGTNTLCIVGRRTLTKDLFLDRRAFLNSYNYKTDPEGNYLAGVMKPLGPVCGGINLEYYFSRVDNHKLGAGTKLPHNVVGLIGVTNSSDGDLRPGLPVQMIEVHDPVRLLIIVEHFPEVVLKTIQSTPDMYEWFINEWVHLIAIDPEANTLHYFKEGKFTPHSPLLPDTKSVTDIEKLFENALEMATNQTVDATQENLPVYLIAK